MRAVVSRVEHACCVVDGQTTGEIARGLLVYVGVVEGDRESDITWMAEKLIALRIFPDDEGKMNRSLADTGGGLLLIPNFTLAGCTRKGTRPSFTDAAPPEVASRMFYELVTACGTYIPVATRIFGAHMHITSEADGPVMLVVDSPAT